jgi:hypothetical protein
LAFLHYLSQLQPGQSFSSSDFTPQGKALFDKAAKDGFIAPVQQQQQSLTDTLTRHTYYQRTNKDPMQTIQQIAGKKDF